jgi:polar amino acid transport system substrate-binding protein
MVRYLLLSLLAFVSLQAQAAESPPPPKPLIIGVEELEYFPDHAWINGTFQGVLADILNAFAADSGYKITYHPLPIRRLYLENLSGQIDLKLPDSPEWAADTKAGYPQAYSNPIMDYVDGVVVKTAKVGQSMDSVKIIGTLSGFTLPAEWKAHIVAGKTTLKENSKSDQLLQQVLVDRIDGAYLSVAAALYTAEYTLGKKDSVAFDPALPYRRGTYHASSLNHPEVIEQLNQWMKNHQERIVAIKMRWGDTIGTKIK